MHKKKIKPDQPFSHCHTVHSNKGALKVEFSAPFFLMSNSYTYCVNDLLIAEKVDPAESVHMFDELQHAQRSEG